jgi:hypothetical protein
MGLDKLSKKELLDKCIKLGIKKCKSKNKKELIKLITKSQVFEEKKVVSFEVENKKKKENFIKGNNKRIESCKKIGKSKKVLGHIIENEFKKQFNISEIDNIEYGSKSDASIDINNSICIKLTQNINVTNFNVSIKSGNNIQFTLGNIPELKDIEIKNLSKLLIYDIFNKYLKKNNSDKPSDILVYKHIKLNSWIFFNMNDIINYIKEKCMWRKLESGRIKGDFNDNSKKGFSQYITYEYRKNHKSFFLGVNGNKGYKFIELLMNKTYGIKYYIEPFNYQAI